MSEDLKAAQARIAELEAWKEQEMQVMSPLMDYARGVCTGPLGCSLADWLVQDHKQLRAELEAIKAQEPVAWAGAIEYGVPLLMVEPQNWKATPLYATPVSEAKAQDFEPLVCDYCNAETQDPWHGSGMLNGVESRHIHACSQCRNLLPTAKALGVVIPEPLTAAITRADDVLHALSSWESSSVKLEQRHGPEWTKEVDAIRRELHTQLARLNATPVQQVSVPDGWKLVPVNATEAILDVLYSNGMDESDSLLQDIWSAMIAAAPAAPAADAGVTGYE